MIQDKPETDREVLEDVGEIKSLALRAKELVRQILTYANNEAVDKEDFDLGELLEETVGFLKKTLPSGISIRLAGLDESVILRGSPTQMHSLIMNVAMNASQAIAKNGVRYSSRPQFRCQIARRVGMGCPTRGTNGLC